MAREKAKKKFYAVAIRENPNIYENWDEAKKQVEGYPKARYRSFTTQEEAKKWLDEQLGEKESGDEQKFQQEKQKKDEPEIKDPSGIVLREAKIKAIPSITASEKAPLSDDVRTYCRRYEFEHLNDDQKRAVQTVNGKVLLFAVPGSGKTSVIIARNGYLIKQCGIDANQIVNLTFTKAAAVEMKNRFKTRFKIGDDKKDSMPQFRTIHSFCYQNVLKELRRVGMDVPINFIANFHKEEIDRETGKKKIITAHSLLYEILKECKVPHPHDEMVQQKVQTDISAIKNRQMENQLERKFITIDKTPVLIQPIYDLYIERLKKYDCMDYDDMLSIALDGLKRYSEVLSDIKNKYQYWSVDEAQDNSQLQNDLIHLLVGENGNLFMVGDDDQSIYSFRGAEPRLLLSYGNEKNVTRLMMGTNYRSDIDIVKASKLFVEQNVWRCQKPMDGCSREKGNISVVYHLNTQEDQYRYILHAVQESRKKEEALAVLFRMNISALPIMFHLFQQRIPFHCPSDFEEILEDKILKELRSVLDYVLNQNCIEAFLKCRAALGICNLTKERKERIKQKHENTPKARIHDLLIQVLQEDDKEAQKAKHEKEIQALGLLSELEKLTPYQAIVFILKRFEYQEYIESLSDRMHIYAFLNISEGFQSVLEFINELEKFQGFVKQTLQKQPWITLSSMHRAKGLEFDHVIIVDSFDEMMNDSLMPKKDGALDFHDREEERRLFYVAITRAKHQLDILTVQSYYGNHEAPTRFIQEFAYICEKKGISIAAPVFTNLNTDNPERICHFQSYYGVRRGRKAGIYSSWEECDKQIQGFSNAEYKKFSNREDAENYVFSGKEQRKLKTNSISSCLLPAPAVVFNRPMDIPEIVTNTLLQRIFQVDDLRHLSQTDLFRIRKQSEFFWHEEADDYHQRAEAYALTYLPVNFYKIWLPMWKVLEEKKEQLEKESILELGAGPGTSTLGLMAFYKELARENPERNFELDYTVVEKEEDFLPIFNALTTGYRKQFPDNLKITFRVWNEDAFLFLKKSTQNQYDLVLESNLFNGYEGFKNLDREDLQESLQNVLSEEGKIILIEPATELEALSDDLFTKRGFLRPVVSAQRMAVDVSQITLMRQMIETGVRTEKMLHWFCYTILERENNVFKCKQEDGYSSLLYSMVD